MKKIYLPTIEIYALVQDKGDKIGTIHNNYNLL